MTQKMTSEERLKAFMKEVMDDDIHSDAYEARHYFDVEGCITDIFNRQESHYASLRQENAQMKETLQWVKEGEDALKFKIKQLREVAEAMAEALETCDVELGSLEAKQALQRWKELKNGESQPKSQE